MDEGKINIRDLTDKLLKEWDSAREIQKVWRKKSPRLKRSFPKKSRVKSRKRREDSRKKHEDIWKIQRFIRRHLNRKKLEEKRKRVPTKKQKFLEDNIIESVNLQMDRYVIEKFKEEFDIDPKQCKKIIQKKDGLTYWWWYPYENNTQYENPVYSKDWGWYIVSIKGILYYWNSNHGIKNKDDVDKLIEENNKKYLRFEREFGTHDAEEFGPNMIYLKKFLKDNIKGE